MKDAIGLRFGRCWRQASAPRIAGMHPADAGCRKTLRHAGPGAPLLSCAAEEGGLCESLLDLHLNFARPVFAIITTAKQASDLQAKDVDGR